MKFAVHQLFADGSWQPPLPTSTAELESRAILVLVFGGRRVEEEPGILDPIGRAFPHAQILGCSTAGEICGTKIYDDSVTVAVLRFAATGLRSAYAEVERASESRAAGEDIARTLADPDLRSVFVLSDGLKVNGTELVRGLGGVLGDGVVITGGLAADGDRFARTWVLRDRRPTSGCVAAVGFYGDRVQIAHGSKGGWDIFGPERIVTRSEGNVLFELDGKPALQLYKTYLGERATGLPATALLFPLALRASRSDVTQTVRTVLAVDEATQSLTFAGDIPQGSFAQLMKANFDRLVQGASDAALASTPRRDADAEGTSGDIAAIAISCVGRRLVLGVHTEEETEATLEILPPGTRQVGFYSYGEISPHGEGTCELHNQTMTLTTITERACSSATERQGERSER